MQKEYKGFIIERLTGKHLGRRGSARKRFGIRIYKDGLLVHEMPPSSESNVSVRYGELTIDSMLLRQRLLSKGIED